MTTMVEPDVKQDTTTDKPDIFHYVKKGEILESTIEGTFARGLCGVRFVVTKVPPPNAVVCPDCKDIYDNVLKD